MDEQESSSGLMIGIIVGGGVAVVLIVLVVIGGALFWRMQPVGGPVFEEAAVEVHAPGAAPDAVAGEERRALDPTERKLVGVWEAKTPAGDVNTLEFRDDHSVEAIAESKGKKATATQRWELIRGKADEIVLHRAPKQGAVDERPIRFLDDDRFELQGPGGWAPYERRPKEKP